MKRVERVRLYPTHSQERCLKYVLDVTCDLYNALLEQRREAYRRRRIVITTIQQYHEITRLRADDGYIGRRLKSVYRECLDAALHRLDLAFTQFFERRRKGKDAGYPRYKSKFRWKQIEFCHGNRALMFDEAQRRLRIPGVGQVRLRRGRRVPPFGRAWVFRKNGKWYACFECERQISNTPAPREIVGVDRGIRVLLATSDGQRLANPRFAAKNNAALTHQQTMTRLTQWTAEEGVANRSDRERLKAIERLSRAKEREQNARRDYLHKSARNLVNSYRAIVLEKLNVRLMTRSARGTVQAPGTSVRAKAGLNRAMLDASFALLRSMIVAEAEEAGRQIIEVPARYTSQTCSQCNERDSQSRRGSYFKCLSCGHIDDADVNAAKVILARAQSALRSEPYPIEKIGSSD
jgi:putative transposase